MIKINIIAVGSLKENYLKQANDEYLKRLSKFCFINITEISETKINNPSDSEIEIIKINEGKLILQKLKGFVVVLDINGKEFDSVGLANFIQNKINFGDGEFTFVIGGSYGLCNEVKNRANLSVSFSKLTFPHQLFRIMLLEQIYRIFCINNNICYHK